MITNKQTFGTLVGSAFSFYVLHKYTLKKFTTPYHMKLVHCPSEILGTHKGAILPWLRTFGLELFN